MYTSYDVTARNMLLHFLHKYFPDNDGLVTPITPLDCDKDNKYFVELFKGLDYKEGYKVLQREIKQRGEHIPPLINSYMNLSSSMRMFGTAINAGFGGVEESGILVKINDIYPEKLERHVAPLIAWAQKIRVKWWKNR